jgi:hypothetical protein
MSLVSHSRNATPTLDLNATLALLSHFVALSLLTSYLSSFDLLQDFIQMTLDLGLQGFIAVSIS